MSLPIEARKQLKDQIPLREEDGMLKRTTALAIMLALSLVLAACGGSAESTTGGEHASTPAPTAAPTEAPQVQPTPTSTAIPKAEPTPVEKTTGGEVSDKPAPTATPQVEPTPTAEAVADEPIDIAAHISEKTMRLWDVYNTHDPDALEEFYSEDYWQEEVDEIRSNMQPFKNLGLTFTAEETSPPTEIEPGKWELKHTARFQGGLVNMVFIYEEFDGDWRLTHAKPE